MIDTAPKYYGGRFPKVQTTKPKPPPKPKPKKKPKPKPIKPPNKEKTIPKVTKFGFVLLEFDENGGTTPPIGVFHDIHQAKRWAKKELGLVNTYKDWKYNRDEYTWTHGNRLGGRTYQILRYNMGPMGARRFPQETS